METNPRDNNIRGNEMVGLSGTVITGVRKPVKWAVIGLASVMALGLSGCSGETPDTSDAAEEPVASRESSAVPTPETPVFQFDQQRVADQSDALLFKANISPVRIQLSPDLKSAASAVGKPTIDHYMVTSKRFSNDVCRLDIEITYAPGGLDFLTSPKFKDQDDHKSKETRLLGSISGSEIYSNLITKVSALPRDGELKAPVQQATGKKRALLPEAGLL